MKKIVTILFCLILLTTGVAQAMQIEPTKQVGLPFYRNEPEHYSEGAWEPETRAENAADRRYKTLPYDFPQIDVLTQGEEIGEGYLFLTNFNWRDFPNSDPYLLIIDNDGEPVYAGRAGQNESGRLITDFKPQPNGQLSYFDRALGYYVLLDSSYTEIGTIEAGNGYPTDLHELIMTEEGHIILMIYHDRPLEPDEFADGMQPNAMVTDLILQELDSTGNVIFEWNSRDHFEITDATIDIGGETIDYSHGNSIDVDFDGNWLISSRHMDEVTKIDRQTGEIIWRLGGKNNDFTFLNDADLFYHQHDARRLANGNLLLFDNGAVGERTTSRAVEYVLDEENFTAAVVQQFAQEPATFSLAMGSANRLANGNTLVGWGSGYPAVTEFRPDGSKAFELALDAPLVSYRVYRSPWFGRPTTPPTLLAELVPGGAELTISWNGATDITGYELYGTTTAGEEALLTFVSKTGFETTHFLPQSQLKVTPSLRIMPLDANQNQTLFSERVTVQAEQIFIPLMMVDQPTVAVPAISEPAAFSAEGRSKDRSISTTLGMITRLYELWYRLRERLAAKPNRQHHRRPPWDRQSDRLSDRNSAPMKNG